MEKDTLRKSFNNKSFKSVVSEFKWGTDSADNDIIYVKVNKEKQRVDFIRDITYSQIFKKTYHIELKMDMLIPRKSEKVPVVVFVKGGGFSKYFKDWSLQQKMAVAEAGYAVITVEHRLVPSYIFPSLIIDVKSAIRYLRAHADEYNLDSSKIAIWGDSSGGYVASMLGATNGIKTFDEGENLEYSSEVQLVIDWYGATDLTTIAKGLGEESEANHLSPSTTEAMLINGIAFGPNKGGSIMSNPDKAATANPLNYINKNTPPFLIMHGTKDFLVSTYESKILYEKLKENNVDATLIMIDGAGHGDDYFYQNGILDMVISFLNEKLV